MITVNQNQEKTVLGMFTERSFTVRLPFGRNYHSIISFTAAQLFFSR